MHKRSITIGGHRTSVALEEEFWRELSNLAEERQLSINALIAEIDQAKGAPGNLSSAVRVHVLKALRRKISRA